MYEETGSEIFAMGTRMRIVTTVDCAIQTRLNACAIGDMNMRLKKQEVKYLLWAHACTL